MSGVYSCKQKTADDRKTRLELIGVIYRYENIKITKNMDREIIDIITKTNTLFFPAKDGIRDCGVTGVQTCALPIFRGLNR